MIPIPVQNEGQSVSVMNRGHSMSVPYGEQVHMRPDYVNHVRELCYEDQHEDGSQAHHHLSGSYEYRQS
jgi:hypothetical protein